MMNTNAVVGRKHAHRLTPKAKDTTREAGLQDRSLSLSPAVCVTPELGLARLPVLSSDTETLYRLHTVETHTGTEQWTKGEHLGWDLLSPLGTDVCALSLCHANVRATVHRSGAWISTLLSKITEFCFSTTV